MKKKQLKWVTATFCDYCGEKITNTFTTIKFKSGKEVDLCNHYKEGEKKCSEKYVEEQNDKDI